MGPDFAVAGPINLGNPRPITIFELAQTVLDLAGVCSDIEYRPVPSDDPVRREPAIEQAVAVLGWQPTVALRDGLAATIDYFRGTIGTQTA